MLRIKYSLIALICCIIFPISLGAAESESVDGISNSKNIISDFEAYKTKATMLIWKGELEKLKTLNRNHSIESYIFTEKCINGITKGNNQNNLLYFTAKKLIEADKFLNILQFKLKEKMVFIESRDINEVVLEPYIDEKHNSDELVLSEYHELLFEITQFYGYNKIDYGLSELVRLNPKATENFIASTLQQAPILHPKSELYQIICSVALLYRNQHHTNKLLKSINDKYGGVGDFLDKENEHQIGTVEIIEGRNDPLIYLAKKMEFIRKLLNDLNYKEAQSIFAKYTKHAEIMLSGLDRSRPYKYMEPMGVDIFLFQALTELRLGDKSKAIEILDDLSKLQNLGYKKAVFAYPEVISNSINGISSNYDLIDSVFTSYKNEHNYSYGFDEFMAKLTGHGYKKISYDYEVFNYEIGNANNDRLLHIYELLLNIKSEIAAIENKIIDFAIIKDRLNKLELDVNNHIERQFGGELKSMSSLDIAKFYAKMKYINVLLKFYSKANKSAIDQREVAAIQNIIGVAYLNYHMPDAALSYLNLSYDYFSNIGERDEDIVQLAYISSNLGFSFYQKKQFDESLFWLNKSLAYIGRIKNKVTFNISVEEKKSIYKHIFEIQNGQGVKSISNSNADTAIVYFNEALQFIEKNTEQFEEESIATIYNNIGSAYRLKKDWEIARKWLEKSATLSRKNDHGNLLCYTYGHLCEVNLGLENEAEALEFCRESLRICDKEELDSRGCKTIDIISSFNSKYHTKEIESIIEKKRIKFNCRN